MPPHVSPDVRIYPDVEELSRAAARSLIETIVAVTGRHRAHCHLALAGGNTPRTLYRLLATEYREQIPWTQVHLFWADERYVPPDDPRSNYRFVRETLLDHVAIPAENVHPMPADLPKPEDAARAYEQTLRSHFSPPWPRFDLVLLGLGADGHTASLFPGSIALTERERWVVAVRAPVDPPLRLTLTLPALNHAAHVFFLVAGAEKADALRRVLTGTPDPAGWPGAGVRAAAGAVVWWVDEKAAKSLAGSADVPYGEGPTAISGLP